MKACILPVIAANKNYNITRSYCIGSLCPNFSPGKKCKFWIDVHNITFKIENIPEAYCAICGKRKTTREADTVSLKNNKMHYNTFPICNPCFNSIYRLKKMTNKCSICKEKLHIFATEGVYKVFCLNEKCKLLGVNIN